MKKYLDAVSLLTLLACCPHFGSRNSQRIAFLSSCRRRLLSSCKAVRKIAKSFKPSFSPRGSRLFYPPPRLLNPLHWSFSIRVIQRNPPDKFNHFIVYMYIYIFGESGKLIKAKVTNETLPGTGLNKNPAEKLFLHLITFF